jgi:hypothetical protein
VAEHGRIELAGTVGNAPKTSDGIRFGCEVPVRARHNPPARRQPGFIAIFHAILQEDVVMWNVAAQAVSQQFK